MKHALGFPLATIEAASAKTDSDVVISAVHHPSHLLNPTASQAFRKVVQENSDFLFTGHEHTVGGQVIAPFTGTSLIHFEGGPYQPSASGDSEFGILHLDLETKAWRHEEFRWSKGAYTKVRDGEPQQLFDKSNRSISLQLDKHFLERVKEPGTGFLHPRQSHLSLSDIYVYPDLRTRSVSKRLRKSEDLPREIASSSVPERILAADRVVITGPSDSGKTGLSKMLFLDGNLRFGRYCVLLYGRSLKGKDPEDAFISALNESIAEQYGEDAHGRYAALPASDRVLIIDDWDEVGYNKPGRKAILNRARAIFATVILFVDDIFVVEDVSGGHEQAPLAGFEIVDLREFGFRLRGQMIRKWHELGNTFAESEQDLARRIAESTRVIDTVLGRNLLPSYPVNILTLLQTYEAGANAQNSGLGSYGQVYEALITASLAKVSVKSIDIGTKITFLSRLAWHLFSTRQRCLSESEWGNLGREYSELYQIPVDGVALRMSCIDAGIVVEDGCGFRFAYGYAYCYFVAKYFQENLADLADANAREALFERLKSLSERVYSQVNADIVIFYVFLTKDRSLISHVIANAGKIFSDLAEFNFDSDVTFVNSVILPLSPICLPETRPEVNQQAYDQQRDEAGEQVEPVGNPELGELLYNPDLPLEQKLVFGMRYVMLMGQVLRNFPGSLKADMKLELAFESYSLGLRILSAVFGLVQRDSALLVKEIVDLLRTKMAYKETDRELVTRAESLVSELLREFTFGVLKRISHAVGLRDLEATYEEVAALRDNSLSNRLIQLSIRLDHFERFPKSEILDLAKDLENNIFSYQTLRDLVMNHLYLFPREYAVQQWAGSILNVQVNKPEILGGGAKLLKGR
jgi:hypothetical protein